MLVSAGFRLFSFLPLAPRDDSARAAPGPSLTRTAPAGHDVADVGGRDVVFPRQGTTPVSPAVGLVIAADLLHVGIGQPRPVARAGAGVDTQGGLGGHGLPPVVNGI